MITVSLDYLDRRIYRKRETEILLPDKSSLFVSDKFAVELFRKLGSEYEHKSSYNSYYHSKDKALLILDEGDFELSTQQKGLFFNYPNWKIQHDLITEHIISNKSSYHYTRADLAFTTTEDWFNLVKKIDFKNLLVKTYSRKNELETILAENSRLDVVFYNKTKSLKKVRNKDYLNSFKEKFPQEQLYRLEIRLKGKDTLVKVPSLMAEKIDLKAIALEIFTALEKRVHLPNKLKNKLKEAIYAIE
ncbi:MAG: hypothetical protein WC635_17500 [Bacteriovorax sp.]|jgi:hypothetical protein